jgi:UDP-N-acetylmuramoyl-tripeptide--D-alanyl-D-alanine ligase
VAEVAELVGGRSRGDAATPVSGVSFDSRAVSAGDLFVAVVGETVDGHTFAGDAARAGAAAALVSRPLELELPQVEVADTVAALQQLAAALRSRSTGRLVGITGSVAKTTTKDFLTALLATTWKVAATRGSRNSQIGLPAELCNRSEGVDWFVAELGMSHAGELDRLGAVARPDALLYTVIAPVHLEFFSGLDAIAEAKAELIPHLAPDGLLVLNAADDRVAAMASRFAGRTVRYGAAGSSELWLSMYRSRGLLGASFELAGPVGPVAVDWLLAGRHQAENLLAAACCALHLGVAREAVTVCASRLAPADHRGSVLRLASGVTLVDDSYNASPLAVRRMLELLAESPGRRIAVLGEMLELGPTTETLHREVGRAAAAACELVLAVGGPGAAALADAAKVAGCGRVEHVPDAEAAAARLADVLGPGDVVLIKGSRGIGLDRTVATLAGEEAA